MEERLNKVLARAGLASRRGADELIESGRVTVNGQIVTELGMRVDPSTDDIRLDGEKIRSKRGKDVYIALYKPRHVITTASDPFDRPTVMDFVEEGERLFPVGRLDGSSEGLLLLTNDGDLANQLAHPQYEHEKEYRVKISGSPTEKALQAWREGVWLEEGRTRPALVTVESSSGPSTWLRIVLKEGKNRQIRRMVEAFNHKVFYLIRTRLGAITLGDMKPGEWRYLSTQEVDALRAGSNAPIQYGETPQEKPARKEKFKYKEGWARPKPRSTRSRRPKGPPAKPRRNRE